MSDPPEGKIVTFYSYKGGTGRTMALANIAWILASNGLKVLVIDWDLESPGLHKFFHPFLDADTIGATTGVIELITEYAFEATRPEPRGGDWHLEYARVLPHAVSLNWDFFPDGGTLDFISAGRQNRDYSSAVSTFDWDNFYERLGGGQFFDALRADMRRHYDYVLIDSRTGLSDVADICTVHFPDILVDCFTLSDQSIDGAAAVARHIDDLYRGRNIRILPVPMRVDDGEKEKLDAGRALARIKFDRFPGGLSQEELSQYWGSVEIPYKPFYAFEETLATFGDAPDSPISMLAAFERLAAVITDGRVQAFPAMDEELRIRYRDAFIRRRLAPTADLFLSYAPEDRMWADWIESVLSRSGFRVLPHGAWAGAGTDSRAQTHHNIEAASRTVAVLSTAYMRSPQARAVWEAMSAADPTGTQRRLLPVRIGDVRLLPPFSDRMPVDLVRLDAGQATEALLRAVGGPAQLPEHPAHPAQTGPRFPGTIPPVWNVPTRNATFTGRGAILEKLRDQLLGSSKAVVIPLALYGLGGVGKTQIALEYAHRFMADYDLVWWIEAEQRELVNPALSELATRLGIRVGESVAEAAQAAREKLRLGAPYSRWLLIFNNADDPVDLEPYLPGGPGHILLTSRNPAWSRVADPVEIDVFTREESVEHLLRRVPGLDPEEASKVAIALGDLPLAIEQAGAWLEETGMPAQTYVEQLGTQATQVLSLNRPTDYPVPVAATWNLSFERLSERSPAAVRLLQLCAFFAPEPISMSLLYGDEMLRSLVPYDDRLREKLVLGQVIREISRFALAKVDQGNNSIEIHRIVQAVIRAQMPEEEQIAACHEVHKILIGARPRQGDTDDPENWPRYDWIWPHLGSSRAAECEEEETRQLLIDRVRYQWKRGELDAALTFGQRLDQAWANRLESDDQEALDRHALDRQVLHLRFQIANVLRSLGRYQEARDLDTRVLAKQQEVLSANHPHALLTAGGLAADLRGLGEFEAALERDRQTYRSFSELFGDDHPRTLAAANNLAVSHRFVGDCFSAQDLDQETLNRRRAVLGPDHPYTLFSAANLARDMCEAGNFSGSTELLRTTYERYLAVLGDEFIDTLRTARSLAVALRRSGAYAEARRLTERTRDRYLQHYGPESPETLACSLDAASDLSALDDKAGARDLAADVRHAYVHWLGADHPYTLAVTSNLAIYLHGTGESAQARALARETLQALRAKLGTDHPFTLGCAINLANLLGDTGDLDEAAALGHETLQLLRDRFGPEHPDTLVCEANLSVNSAAAGRQDEARQIQDRVLPVLIRVLGEQHPHVTALREWRRTNRDLDLQPM